jgi:transposase-like protein
MKQTETERRMYTKEYKEKIIAMTYESGKTVNQVARETGINEKTIRLWRREKREAKAAGADAFPGYGVPKQNTVLTEKLMNDIEVLQGENKKLMCEIKVLQGENETLKKTLRIFVKENWQ